MAENIKDHVLAVVAALVGDDSATVAGGVVYPGGEKNTASNLDDVGLFAAKVGADLQFRGLGTETPETVTIGISGDGKQVLINVDAGTLDTLQSVYERGNTLTTSAAEGNLVITAGEAGAGVYLVAGAAPVTIGNGGSDVNLVGAGGTINITGGTGGVQITSGASFGLTTEGPSAIVFGAPVTSSNTALWTHTATGGLTVNATGAITVNMTGPSVTFGPSGYRVGFAHNGIFAVPIFGNGAAGGSVRIGHSASDVLDLRGRRAVTAISTAVVPTSGGFYEVNVNDWTAVPSGRTATRFVVSDNSGTGVHRAGVRGDAIADGAVAASPENVFVAWNTADTTAAVGDGSAVTGLTSRVNTAAGCVTGVANIYLSAENTAATKGGSQIRLTATNTSGGGTAGADDTYVLLGSDGRVILDAEGEVADAVRIHATGAAGGIQFYTARGDTATDFDRAGDDYGWTTSYSIVGAIGAALSAIAAGVVADGVTILGTGTAGNPLVAERLFKEFDDLLGTTSEAHEYAYADDLGATIDNYAAFDDGDVQTESGMSTESTAAIATALLFAHHVTTGEGAQDNTASVLVDAVARSVTLDDSHLALTLTEDEHRALAGQPTGRDSLVGLFNALFNGDILTGTTDTPIQLTAANLAVVSLSGSGHNVEMYLPDATTLPEGCTRTVVNTSSEISVLKGYAGNTGTFTFLVPGEEARCTLIDNSTAAGVWSLRVVGDKLGPDGFDIPDEFLGAAGSLAYDRWATVSSGTGATTGFTQYRPNSQGVIQQSTGSTATGATAIWGYYGTVFGAGAWLGQWNVSHYVLSTSTEEYSSTHGWFDGRATFAQSDGIYFRYDRAANDPDGDYWTIGAVSNGTATEVLTSAVPNVAGDWDTFSIVVASDASRVDFWIGPDHVGSITTNIPTGTARNTEFASQIIKTVGTGIAYKWVDWTRVVHTPTTRRL